MCERAGGTRPANVRRGGTAWALGLGEALGLPVRAVADAP